MVHSSKFGTLMLEIFGKEVLIALRTRNLAPSGDYGCASTVDGTWSMSSLRSSFRSEGNSIAASLKLMSDLFFR